MIKNKEKIFDITLVGTTAILITICSLLFRENVFVVVPLYVSLFVWFLQSKANKYAFLLGGLNSILYAAVDLFNGLYATAVYDVLVSCTLQIVTFLNWNKHSYGKNSTIFKRLSVKQIILIASAGVAVWEDYILFYLSLAQDICFLITPEHFLGITATILCALSFIEYTYLQQVNIAVSLVMYALMFKEEPIMITHFIFNIYALICSARSFIKMKKLYKEQQSIKGEGKNVQFNQ